MGAANRKKLKVGRKLKSARLRNTQSSLTSRCGAWFLEPRGDQNEIDSALRQTKTHGQTQSQARDTSANVSAVFEDNNDEFERDRIGF